MLLVSTSKPYFVGEAAEVARRYLEHRTGLNGEIVADPRSDKVFGGVEGPTATLRALGIIRDNKLSTEHAQALIEDPNCCICCDEYLLQASRPHISKTGKNLAIIIGRSITDSQDHVFLAYPEVPDLSSFSRISKAIARPAGPGYIYPGSVAAMEFCIYGDSLSVGYLQSSFFVKQAVAQNFLSKDYLRAYSAWSITLISRLFEYAESLGVKELVLPEDRVTAAIGEDRFSKLAARHGFRSCESSCRDNLSFEKIPSQS